MAGSKETSGCSKAHNVEALIIRIGFWGYIILDKDLGFRDLGFRDLGFRVII